MFERFRATVSGVTFLINLDLRCANIGAKDDELFYGNSNKVNRDYIIINSALKLTKIL